MNQKLVKFGKRSFIFASGYVLGDLVRAKLIQKKLLVVIPLMENAIRSVTIRAIEDNLSKEQVSDLMADEYSFMSMIIRK